MNAVVNACDAEAEIAQIAGINGWVETSDVHESPAIRWRRWHCGPRQIRAQFDYAGQLREAHVRTDDGEWNVATFPRRRVVVMFLIHRGAAR